MKTHILPLIRVVDELNDKNAAIRLKQRNKPIVEVYSYHIWEYLGIKEVVV